MGQALREGYFVEARQKQEKSLGILLVSIPMHLRPSSTKGTTDAIFAETSHRSNREHHEKRRRPLIVLAHSPRKILEMIRRLAQLGIRDTCARVRGRGRLRLYP